MSRPCPPPAAAGVPCIEDAIEEAAEAEAGGGGAWVRNRKSDTWVSS